MVHAPKIPPPPRPSNSRHRYRIEIKYDGRSSKLYAQNLGDAASIVDLLKLGAVVDVFDTYTGKPCFNLTVTG